ncbi:hypothetical protein [Kitasatospora fiedleri]|uniref:hypothetical protein n=1 Tax=Kitasatospora fiedleri TaxID=2991545 RepID=UPI00249CEFC0|nr:hypothetical protein [Kitasatospora fiedleri]
MTTTPAQAQEIEATASEYTAAMLDGQELRVLAPGKWRPSFLRALRSGDFDTWAELALHPDDVATFIEVDATFDALSTFTADAMTGAGEAPGNSRGRSASSKRTRKS